MDNLVKYVCLGLLVLPVAAWVAFALLKRNVKLSNAIVAVCLGGLALTVVALLAKLSFRSSAANVYWLLAAYFAYAFAVFSGLRLKPGALKVITLIAAALPILAGYFMATVGILGLFGLVDDAIRPPTAVEAVRPGIGCETSKWNGGVLDYGGYSVHLYAYWGPLLKREIDVIHVDQSPSAHNAVPDATCADVIARHPQR